jgi:N-acetylglutamate synthase-like GNAT family acetyltransferase
MSLRIIDMPDDAGVQSFVAKTCVSFWRRDFPHDTDEWYLTLYAESLRSQTLPIVLIAHMGDEVVGTASLIADDELPDATELGPWLAAVFVEEERRGTGVGTALVQEMMTRARALQIERLYLYTENAAAWYQLMGWRTLRTARLSDHDVTVMCCDL